MNCDREFLRAAMHELVQEEKNLNQKRKRSLRRKLKKTDFKVTVHAMQTDYLEKRAHLKTKKEPIQMTIVLPVRERTDPRDTLRAITEFN